MALWSLRERPPASLRPAFVFLGAAALVAFWWGISAGLGVPKSVLPSPADVLRAFPTMVQQHDLLRHATYSVSLNLASYAVAVVVAVPIGFVLGLFGPFRTAFEGELAVFRFVPITAFVGIFIRWFGISHMVKVQFLAFGLLVFLVAAVVQLIDEVEPVYVDTAKTCGATRWQRISTVFWPLVSARLSDVCRNLVAITWTYLFIAEGFNLSEGGLGALAQGYTRAGRWDMVFAVVAIVTAIGYSQDRIWTWIDRRIYRWKHA